MITHRLDVSSPAHKWETLLLSRSAFSSGSGDLRWVQKPALKLCGFKALSDPGALSHDQENSWIGSWICHRIPQNHRIHWVGKDPSRSLSRAPGLTQDTPRTPPVTETIIQTLVGLKQAGAVTPFLGSLFQCTATLWVKNLSLTSSLNLP